MTSNWRVSLFIGGLSFFFTYLFANVNNTWQVSLFRATIGFLVFFLLGYISRFLLNQMQMDSMNSAGLPKEDEEIIVRKKGEEQSMIDIDQDEDEDPFFQEVTLGSLHNGDSIKSL